VQTNIPSGAKVNAIVSAPNGSGGANLFAGTLTGGVFLSTNNGTNWTAVNNGLTRYDIYSLSVSPDGSKLFAGTGGVGMFLSTNNGTSWTSVSDGLTNGFTRDIRAILFNGKN